MAKTLVHRYEPRGAARTLLAKRDDEVVLSGPAGTGKSRACLEKLNLAMLKYPKARALIVRKTATSLTNTALVTFDKQVVPEALKTGLVSWYGGSAREPAQYRYPNGSTVNVGGMDKATRVMSADYDLIYVQEATELSVADWEALTTRLRNGVMPYQQLISDCNPDAPTHWLKQRADSAKVTMLFSRHEDNPILFTEAGELTERGIAYIGRLDALTGVRYHRLRHGRWTAAEGAIYDFDPAVHLVDKLPEGSQDWARYWSVDFGFTHPFVLQRWAQDPDGRLWLYAETYRTGLTLDQHVKNLMSELTDDKGNWLEPKPQRIVADSEDPEGRVVLQRELGLPVQPAKKGPGSVNAGIQAVQRRLRVADDGKPRILFVRNAVHSRDAELVSASKPCCTVDEIPGYVWKDGTREEPVKDEDDGCDALRYLVSDRDLRGEARVRWVA